MKGMILSKQCGEWEDQKKVADPIFRGKTKKRWLTPFFEAMEALEEALETYQGTIILVSHDRYFLETAKLDLVYVLSDGVFTKIPDYTVYVKEAEARAEQLLRSL